ncbi:MAG: amidohydrolase [Campylobacteraceae bacterium]
MKSKIKDIAKSLEKKLISVRRDLHKHPEPGWTEFRTASFALKTMQALGYKITMGKDAVKKESMMGVPSETKLKEEQARAIAQGADPKIVEAMSGGLTGFWADMEFSKDGPKLAFRFDMDSNDGNESCEGDHRPVKEGFNSINKGAMHTCGHDGHTSVGLALAEIVAGMKNDLKGSVRFIFQPAEEGLRGAKPMVDAGACKDVDFIIGTHIGVNATKNGDLICGGYGFLASTKLDVYYKGVASHAGINPHDGKNALLAACTAATNMHAISRHSGGATRINVGKIVAGEGRNVLPPSGMLVLETRGFTSELNEYMEKEARRMIEAAALMWDCEYKIEVMGGAKSGETDDVMMDVIEKAAKDVPFYTNIKRYENFVGGEDFTFMMDAVQKIGGKGTFIQVGAKLTTGHHNGRFDFDESGLVAALELLSLSAYDILHK